MMRFDGDKLRNLRKERDMSQQELAQRIRCASGAVSLNRWENGKAQPDTASVVALAKILSVKVEELYREVEA